MIGAVENRSITYERAFSEVKRLSLAGHDGPELLRRVAEKLEVAIPFEAYSVFTTDPATNLITHGAVEGVPRKDEAGKKYYGRVYFEEDFRQDALMFRERRPVELLSERTEGKLERSVLYRELLRPWEFGHKLFSVFADGSPWGRLTLMRGVGDPDFDGRDVALLRRIAPHIGAGLKAATLRRAATTEPASDDAPGVLTLDLRGRVYSHTPAAQSLLSELEELGPDWQESDLPVVVTIVANAVRCSLAPESDRHLNLIPRVRVRARSGRWLTLYGSLTEPSFDRPSQTVIVIEPTKPEEVAWFTVVAYGLSPREEEVVKLVVRGLSNRQISQKLFISENTVQRHLSNIFEKVGVRSRKGLLKRLFFDNLLPSLLGD